LLKVSAFHPHFGEKSCLVGFGGSGTIFLTSCNLACVYCQNFEISQLRIGEEVRVKLGMFLNFNFH
jgi:putative pyruvate formate lyase activating enzyme